MKLLDFRYEGINQKLFATDKDEYVVYCSVNNLRKKESRQIFSKSNPYVIKNMTTYLNIIGESSNYEIISLEYLGGKSNLIWKCLKHNINFEMSWGNFKKGCRCKKCRGIEEYTIDSIILLNNKINPTVKIMSNEFLTVKTKLECLCTKHNDLFYSSWDNLGRGFIGCRECFSEKLSRENHYLWNPNKTQKEREDKRNYLGYSQFVKSALKRYNYTCDITGKRGGKLAVHHLNGYHWFIEGRIDVNNAVVLTRDIHNEFHSIYGKGNNTKEQYEEFRIKKLIEISKQMEVV